ncbi:SGS1 [Culex quinquefasciatus]|nr:SGS1 [Culex quinquefasciatus]|eukprot:XP_001849225.1 SGS1 [Culex quinquefasciatus]
MLDSNNWRVVKLRGKTFVALFRKDGLAIYDDSNLRKEVILEELMDVTNFSENTKIKPIIFHGVYDDRHALFVGRDNSGDVYVQMFDSVENEMNLKMLEPEVESGTIFGVYELGETEIGIQNPEPNELKSAEPTPITISDDLLRKIDPTLKIPTVRWWGETFGETIFKEAVNRNTGRLSFAFPLVDIQSRMGIPIQVSAFYEDSEEVAGGALGASWKLEENFIVVDRKGTVFEELHEYYLVRGNRRARLLRDFEGSNGKVVKFSIVDMKDLKIELRNEEKKLSDYADLADEMQIPIDFEQYFLNVNADFMFIMNHAIKFEGGSFKAVPLDKDELQLKKINVNIGEEYLLFKSLNDTEINIPQLLLTKDKRGHVYGRTPRAIQSNSAHSVVSMTTISGLGQPHKTRYEYLDPAELDTNIYFLKTRVIPGGSKNFQLGYFVQRTDFVNGTNDVQVFDSEKQLFDKDYLSRLEAKSRKEREEQSQELNDDPRTVIWDKSRRFPIVRAAPFLVGDEVKIIQINDRNSSGYHEFFYHDIPLDIQRRVNQPGNMSFTSFKINSTVAYIQYHYPISKGFRHTEERKQNGALNVQVENKQNLPVAEYFRTEDYNNLLTTYDYDSGGNLIQVLPPNHHENHDGYDALNESNSSPWEIKSEYYNNSKLLRTRRTPDTGKMEFLYNENDHLQFQFHYDDAGKLDRIRYSLYNLEGRTREFGLLDPSFENRLRSKESFDRGNTFMQFSYGEEDSVLRNRMLYVFKQIEKQVQEEVFLFDGEENLISRDVIFNEDIVANRSMQFFYENEKISTIRYPTKLTVFYSHNSRGEMTSITDNFGTKIASFTHDPQGKVATIVHEAENFTVTYLYDIAGHLLQIKSPFLEEAISHQDGGYGANPVGDGTILRTEFRALWHDKCDQSRITLKVSDFVGEKMNYELADRCFKALKEKLVIDGLGRPVKTFYPELYDDLPIRCFTRAGGRHVAKTVMSKGFPLLYGHAYKYGSHDVHSFSIDKNGNHKLFYTGFERYEMKYKPFKNQIESIKISSHGKPTNFILEHNSDGNVIRADHKGISRIEYDHLVQRASKIVTSKVTVELSYDYKGERTSKFVRNKSGDLLLKLHYVRDPKGNVLVELKHEYPDPKQTDKPIVTVTSYIRGPLGLIGFYRNNEYYSILQDHEGSTRLVVKGGQVIAAYDYLPYGQLIRRFNSDPDGHITYLYTGQEFDEETGLYNYHARLYDPDLGRFYQVDPQEQYPSPYKYAGNSPISLVDPDGEFAFTLFLICLGFFLAGAAHSNTFDVSKWDFKDPMLYLSMFGGIVGGLAAGMGAAASVSFFTLFFSGSSVAGHLVTGILSVAGALFGAAGASNEWNPAKWDWTSPKIWSGLFGGATVAINLPGAYLGILRTMAFLGKTVYKTTLPVLLIGFGYLGGSMANDWEFNPNKWSKGPKTFFALLDATTMSLITISTPMKLAKPVKSLTRLILHKKDLVLRAKSFEEINFGQDTFSRCMPIHWHGLPSVSCEVARLHGTTFIALFTKFGLAIYDDSKNLEEVIVDSIMDSTNMADGDGVKPIILHGVYDDRNVLFFGRDNKGEVYVEMFNSEGRVMNLLVIESGFSSGVLFGVYELGGELRFVGKRLEKEIILYDMIKPTSTTLEIKATIPIGSSLGSFDKAFKKNSTLYYFNEAGLYVIDLDTKKPKLYCNEFSALRGWNQKYLDSIQFVEAEPTPLTISDDLLRKIDPTLKIPTVRWWGETFDETIFKEAVNRNTGRLSFAFPLVDIQSRMGIPIQLNAFYEDSQEDTGGVLGAIWKLEENFIVVDRKGTVFEERHEYYLIRGNRRARLLRDFEGSDGKVVTFKYRNYESERLVLYVDQINPMPEGRKIDDYAGLAEEMLMPLDFDKYFFNVNDGFILIMNHAIRFDGDTFVAIPVDKTELQMKQFNIQIGQEYSLSKALNNVEIKLIATKSNVTLHQFEKNQPQNISIKYPNYCLETFDGGLTVIPLNPDRITPYKLWNRSLHPASIPQLLLTTDQEGNVYGASARIARIDWSNSVVTMTTISGLGSPSRIRYQYLDPAIMDTSVYYRTTHVIPGGSSDLRFGYFEQRTDMIRGTNDVQVFDSRKQLFDKDYLSRLEAKSRKQREEQTQDMKDDPRTVIWDKSRRFPAVRAAPFQVQDEVVGFMGFEEYEVKGSTVKPSGVTISSRLNEWYILQAMINMTDSTNPRISLEVKAHPFEIHVDHVLYAPLDLNFEAIVYDSQTALPTEVIRNNGQVTRFINNGYGRKMVELYQSGLVKIFESYQVRSNCPYRKEFYTSSSIPSSGRLTMLISSHFYTIWIDGSLIQSGVKVGLKMIGSKLSLAGSIVLSDIVIIDGSEFLITYLNRESNPTQEIQLGSRGSIFIRQTLYDEVDRKTKQTLWTKLQHTDVKHPLGYQNKFVESHDESGSLHGLVEKFNPKASSYPYQGFLYHNVPVDVQSGVSQPGSANTTTSSVNSTVPYILLHYPTSGGFRHSEERKLNGAIHVSVEDNRNQVVAEYARTEDYNNILTTYEYDELGNLLRMIPPNHHEDHDKYVAGEKLESSPWDIKMEYYGSTKLLKLRQTPDFGRMEFVYNEYDQLRFQFHYGDDGKLVKIKYYLYNIEGRTQEFGLLDPTLHGELRNDPNKSFQRGDTFILFSYGEEDPALRNRMVYVFKQNENLTQEEVFLFDEEENLISRDVISNGEMVKNRSIQFYHENEKISAIHYPTNITLLNNHNSRGEITSITDRFGTKIATFTHDPQGKVASIVHEVENFTVTYSYDTAGHLLKIKSPFLEEMISHQDGGYGAEPVGDGTILRTEFRALWHDKAARSQIALKPSDFVSEKMSYELAAQCYRALKKKKLIDTLGRPVRTFYPELYVDLPIKCSTGVEGNNVAEMFLTKGFPQLYGHAYKYGSHGELIEAKSYIQDERDSLTRPLNFKRFHEEFRKARFEGNATSTWENLKKHYLISKGTNALQISQYYETAIKFSTLSVRLKFKNIANHAKIIKLLAPFFATELGKSPADVHSFSIDKNGNHKLFYTGFERYEMKYKPFKNQIESIKISSHGKATNYILEHNSDGNVIRADHKDISRIEYDHLVQRASKIVTSKVTVELTYDYKGERTSKFVRNKSGDLLLKLHYIRDPKGNVLVELKHEYPDPKKTDKPIVTVTSYIRGPLGLIGFYRNDEYYSILQDHEGSTRLVVKGGQVIAAYDYLPYGQLIRRFNSDPDGHVSYLYTGQEFDEETGLYNYHARLYDPDLGRFYQVDLQEQYPSPYKYAGNSPISLVDPDGEFAFLLFMIFLGAFLAGAAHSKTFDVTKWNFKDPMLYLSMFGGAVGGAAAAMGAAASLSFFTSFFGGSTVAGVLATGTLAVAGALFGGAGAANEWNPAKWDWTSPALYSGFFRGATFALSLPGAYLGAVKMMAMLGKTVYKTGLALLIAGFGYIGGAMANDWQFNPTKWDTGPKTLFALFDGTTIALLTASTPMKLAKPLKSLTKFITHKKDLVMRGVKVANLLARPSSGGM